MRQSRVYTPQVLENTDRIALQGSTAHYLLRVLRLSEGGAVTLFNGDGRDYVGEIHVTQRQRVVVKITGRREPGNESSLKVSLIQAVSKGNRMDYALQKATELGVYRVQPLITHRVEVKLDDKRQARRLRHWRAVVISACEQCGRACVPDVSEPVSLNHWLAQEHRFPRLLLDRAAENSLSAFTISEPSVSLLVGPEGGLTKDELGAAKANGVVAVSLGSRILRTETAGPAAIAILQALNGDL